MYGQALFTRNHIDLEPLIRQFNVRIVSITDEKEYIPYPNIVTASTLLPPYEALEAVVEGDIPKATSIYGMWLQSSIPQKIFGIILGALHIGINICLYYPEDTTQKGDLINTFLGFLDSFFGIRVGGIPNGKYISPMISSDAIVDGVRLHAMVMASAISVEEFCKEYNADPRSINANVARVIYAYFHGGMITPSMEEVYRFIAGYMINLKSEVNGFVNPIIRTRF